MLVVDVSVGLIIQDKHVFMAKRHVHQHQGGLWEFPGGKVESGETPFVALQRELREEVAIDVMHAKEVMTIEHDYSEKTVRLVFFQVTDFTGEPQHCEGQECRWVPFAELDTLSIPEANKNILNFFQC